MGYLRICPSRTRDFIKQRFIRNAQLRDIKLDKIKTLQEIYEVTDQLGRDHPQRRDEVTRSKIEIEAKLMTAVAELLCIEDEITRGCTTCREN